MLHNGANLINFKHILSKSLETEISRFLCFCPSMSHFESFFLLRKCSFLGAELPKCWVFDHFPQVWRKFTPTSRAKDKNGSWSKHVKNFKKINFHGSTPRMSTFEKTLYKLPILGQKHKKRDISVSKGFEGICLNFIKFALLWSIWYLMIYRVSDDLKNFQNWTFPPIIRHPQNRWKQPKFMCSTQEIWRKVRWKCVTSG